MGAAERIVVADDELDRMQRVADPPADETIGKIVGPWPAGPGTPAMLPPAVSAEEAARDTAASDALRRLRELNPVLATWHDNRSVAEWRASDAQIESGLGKPLEEYVRLARPLPDWADRERIARAEEMFWDHGALSVTLLFCASLPECYVVPDLAAVLHATGQLEKRVEHRIRTTGAMIFPVMMRGGLTAETGSGIAQILKVRLIHATVRNLILRASPGEALAALAAAGEDARGPLIPRLATIQPGDSMHAALFAHGWDLEANGLPNNQEELAYTLLTFSYVFLRAMRRLGIGFTPAEEEDYLHAWNVAGHFLGIRRELMVDNMRDAEALFARMQARGRAERAGRDDRGDVRPALGAALMDGMKSVMPRGAFRAFPVLLTRHLLEPDSVRDLRLNEHVSWFARLLFTALLALARAIDRTVRLVLPHFSICRLLTRAIGYRLTCALMMSETHELSVPDRLRPGIRGLIRRWGRDARAGPVMNGLEDLVTTRGEWHPLQRRRR